MDSKPTKAEVEQKIRRYKQLIDSKPDLAQIARYGGIGAGVGLASGVAENAVKGNPRLFGEYVPPGGKNGIGPIARAIGGRVVGSALTLGAVPYVRHLADKSALRSELEQDLKQLGVEQHRYQTPVAPVVPVTDKVAFEVSQFSGPLSMGVIPHVSHLPDPGQASEPMQRALQNKRVMEMKVAGLPTTPQGWTQHSKSIGVPGSVASHQVPGLGAQSKPKGYGTVMPGAQKVAGTMKQDFDDVVQMFKRASEQPPKPNLLVDDLAAKSPRTIEQAISQQLPEDVTLSGQIRSVLKEK